MRADSRTRVGHEAEARVLHDLRLDEELRPRREREDQHVGDPLPDQRQLHAEGDRDGACSIDAGCLLELVRNRVERPYMTTIQPPAPVQKAIIAKM